MNIKISAIKIKLYFQVSLVSENPVYSNVPATNQMTYGEQIVHNARHDPLRVLEGASNGKYIIK